MRPSCCPKTRETRRRPGGSSCSSSTFPSAASTASFARARPRWSSSIAWPLRTWPPSRPSPPTTACGCSWPSPPTAPSSPARDPRRLAARPARRSLRTYDLREVGAACHCPKNRQRGRGPMRAVQIFGALSRPCTGRRCWLFEGLGQLASALEVVQGLQTGRVLSCGFEETTLAEARATLADSDAVVRRLWEVRARTVSATHTGAQEMTRTRARSPPPTPSSHRGPPKLSAR